MEERPFPRDGVNLSPQQQNEDNYGILPALNFCDQGLHICYFSVICTIKEKSRDNLCIYEFWTPPFKDFWPFENVMLNGKLPYL